MWHQDFVFSKRNICWHHQVFPSAVCGQLRMENLWLLFQHIILTCSSLIRNLGSQAKSVTCWGCQRSLERYLWPSRPFVPLSDFLSSIYVYLWLSLDILTSCRSQSGICSETVTSWWITPCRIVLLHSFQLIESFKHVPFVNDPISDFPAGILPLIKNRKLIYCMNGQVKDSIVFITNSPEGSFWQGSTNFGQLIVCLRRLTYKLIVALRDKGPSWMCSKWKQIYWIFKVADCDFVITPRTTHFH